MSNFVRPFETPPNSRCQPHEAPMNVSDACKSTGEVMLPSGEVASENCYERIQCRNIFGFTKQIRNRGEQIDYHRNDNS